MAMESEGMSVADVLAITKGGDNGFLGGSTGGILALIIVFILIFGNGGFGFGGNALTQSDIQRGFDTQTVMTQLNSIGNGICSSSYENAQLINNLGVNVMNSSNNIVSTLNTGFDAVNANIANLAYQMQQSCCDIKTQMLQDKYEAAQNALNNANTIVSNQTQTQTILNALGRFVQNPPCPLYYNYNYGTTLG